MDESTNELSAEWKDLLEAIPLLAKGATKSFPFHCEHDILTVTADPSVFTAAELQRLDELGFFVDSEGECFASFRYGSA